MKRTRKQYEKKSNSIQTTESKIKASNTISMDNDFLDQCNTEFQQDPTNVITRNAIVAIGSKIATINSERLKKIDHIFLNSLKKKDVKATNQGMSGRCWMFSGLNMFRHNVISALELENFEFSQTYLFFYDKLERCNSYLKWFIDHPTVETGSQEFYFIVGDFMSDGGWWNCFSNLVKKYGLIPKNAMQETFQSQDSEDMNQILTERIQECANYILKHPNLSNNELLTVKNKTMKQIYFTLVKFLGEPPKKFQWAYTDEENHSSVVSGLSPKTFYNMIAPSIEMDDFILLSNVPTSLKYNKIYNIKYTNNIYDGDNCQFLNLRIDELIKYTTKSILAGFPVWFAADVSHDFNPYHSALDDQLSSHQTIFGNIDNFSKGDRILFRQLQGNHAMTFTGVNLDQKGKAVSFQVENSWGFWDNETPGEDGFLFMSTSWFRKNVLQVVVHKNFLSRTVNKLLNQEPISVDPWDSVAPAVMVRSVKQPQNYLNMLKYNSKKKTCMF